MRKPLGFSAFLVVLAGVLGACNVSVTPIAVRVNGASISVDTLNAVVTGIGSDRGYLCDVAADANELRGVGPSGVRRRGNHTYATSFVSQQLQLLIGAAVLHQNLQAMHLTSSTLAPQIAALTLESELAPPASSNCSTPGAKVLADLSPGARTSLISFLADEAILAAHLVGLPLNTAGVTSYEKAHPAQTQLSCVDAILVATATAAAGVERQLAAGADFAAVAKADSTDTTSAADGGAIGCIPYSTLSAPLNSIVAQLGVGKNSAAIPYSGQYVVLRVSARETPTTPEAAQLVVEGEVQQAAFTTRLDALLQKANVVVSPPYGTWGKSSGSYVVSPPKAPADALLANPGAVSVTHAQASG